MVLIKKTIYIMMMLTLLSKFLGFARELFLAYFWGTSSIIDAYLVALTIPGVIFGFVGAGITASYIPIYTRIKKEKGNMSAIEYTNNLTNFILILTTIIFIISFASADILVRISASGFNDSITRISVSMTRIILFSMYFSGVISISSAYLHANNKFYISSLINIPLNLINIFFIYISKISGYIYLAIGYVVAVFIEVVILLPAIKKTKYKYRLKLNLNDEYLKKSIYFAIPVIIGISANKINVLVDRTIASNIMEGGIASLNYAFRISDIIEGIFVLSIITVIYPTISLMAVNLDFQNLKIILNKTITSILFLTLPASLGLILFSSQIVSLLYGRGAFDSDSINYTSGALTFYSVGLIAIALREVTSRVFYALEDSKTPVVNAIIGVLINIFLNILLSRFMGLNGVALATSISAIITTILLFFNLHKKIGSFGLKEINVSFLKILFASLIMCLFAKFSFNFFKVSLSQNISLILAIGVGTVSYFGIIYFMKIKDIDILVDTIKKKLEK